MSLQIAKIVLYSRKGEVRELEFKAGRFNVLTGASKTGKSAIIDIVDYCTGRSECNVADGVTRRYVGWYAILFQLNGSQIFVARRNPDIWEKTNPDVYLARGAAIETPPASTLTKNITVDALEKFLGAAIGISENEHLPPQPTRDPLEANFRHALLFSFQDQNDIDSKQRLFHRQGEDFISQAIKDILPYFLGAIDEDRLLKQAQLDQARRQLRQLERQLREAEAIDTTSYPRAQALLDEAKQVGLVDERTITTTYEVVIEILKRIADDDQIQSEVVMADGEDMLAGLRAERQGLRNELERVNAEIRSTRTFTLETTGYEREAKEQRARLSAVGLIRPNGHDAAVCPVCESHLNTPAPTVAQIGRSLRTSASNWRPSKPRTRACRPDLPLCWRMRRRFRNACGTISCVSTRMRENKFFACSRRISFFRRAIGKITQYVETARTGDADRISESRSRSRGTASRCLRPSSIPRRFVKKSVRSQTSSGVT